MKQMMSSVGAWNEYMDSFLTELCETFPDCPVLFATRDAAKLMAERDEMSVLNKYVAEISPHGQALTDMNDSFFLKADIKFLKDIGIRKYWTAELEPETKNAIWQYLQTLLMMAQTIQSVPPSLLRVIENYASKVTGQLEASGQDGSQLDLHAVGMGALNHMREQDPSAFNSMFGGAATTPATTTTRPELQEPTPTSASAGPGDGEEAPIGWEKLQEMLTRGTHPKTPGSIPFPSLPRPTSEGEVWGTPTGPLFGNHPIFLGKPARK